MNSNDTLNETTATWLLVTDASTSAEARRLTAATLLAHATLEDDVVFADEAGVNEFAPILKSPSVGPHTLLSYDVVGRPALLRVRDALQVRRLLARRRLGLRARRVPAPTRGRGAIPPRTPGTARRTTRELL